jgi:hypothetical protein
VTSGSRDGGIDVVATKTLPFEQRVVIQAKRYAEGNPVGSPDIQQYSSLRHQEESVDAVIVITTSSFTTEAEKISDDLNVKLINGERFVNALLNIDSESIIEEYIDGRSDLADRVLVENYLDPLDSPPWESSGAHSRCPFCGKTVSATRDSFTQHWKSNTSCNPDES